MLAHRTLAWLLTVGTLSAATIAGCSSPDTVSGPSRSSGLTESNVELRVALGPTGLKLIDVAPIPSLVLPVAEHELEADEALHWTFVGASGELARVCARNGTTYCCKASAPAPSGATRCTRDADCANDQVCAQTTINAQTMNCVPRGTGACEGAR